MPFQVVRNDITKMQVDAIVNTANPLPTFGPGTDAAIYKAAGQEQLLEKRKEIGNMEPGTSVITEGFMPTVPLSIFHSTNRVGSKQSAECQGRS